MIGVLIVIIRINCVENSHWMVEKWIDEFGLEIKKGEMFFLCG